MHCQTKALPKKNSLYLHWPSGDSEQILVALACSETDLACSQYFLPLMLPNGFTTLVVLNSAHWEFYFSLCFTPFCVNSRDCSMEQYETVSLT